MKSFFVLASSHVISGIMYRTAVIIRKISPDRMNLIGLIHPLFID